MNARDAKKLTDDNMPTINTRILANIFDNIKNVAISGKSCYNHYFPEYQDDESCIKFFVSKLQNEGYTVEYYYPVEYVRTLQYLKISWENPYAC